MLAIMPAMLCLPLFSRKRIRTLLTMLVVGSLLLLAAYTFVPGLADYLTNTFSADLTRPEAANYLGRLNLASALFRIFLENPILGYGPGLIQKLAFQGLSQFEGLAGLENQYATILADGGIVAGLSYLSFMVAALATSYRVARSSEREVRYLGLMMLVIFVFYFLVTVSATSLALLPNYTVMAIAGAVFARYDHEVRASGASSKA